MTRVQTRGETVTERTARAGTLLIRAEVFPNRLTKYTPGNGRSLGGSDDARRRLASLVAVKDSTAGRGALISY
jgi:hypothetical protein